MALSDRDIIITPNRGSATEPNILYRGADASNSGTITLTVLNTGSTAILRWSGSAGNLVSITNTSGTVLNVLSTTQATSTLTGALQVAGGVGIQGNLWVGGTINGTIAGAGSATTATNLAGGTANQIPVQTAPNTTGFIVAPSVANTVLTWNGSAFVYALPASTFNGGTITNPLFINNATPTSSTSTGAFVVLGGVGIGGGLVVGNITTITNTTNASSTATGAFQVLGGAAVGLDLRVGGSSFINGSETITGNLAVNGGSITSSAATFNLLNSGVTTLNLAGGGTAITVGAATGYTAIRNQTTVTNTTNASSTNSGALVVTGGAGIGGNLYVGGALVVNGTPVTPVASLFIEITATAAQTIFTIPGGYTAPYIQVFANGVLLSTANYTASNGTTVVVNNARNAGDVMRFIAGSNVLGFTTSTFANNILGGAANQLVVQTGLNATGFITAPVTSNTVLTWNGSAFVWSTPSAASTTVLIAGTATSALFFPAFVDANNATPTAEVVYTTSSFTINPSTRAIVAGGQFDNVGVANLGTGVIGDVLFAGSAGARMIVNTGGAGVRIVSEGANPLSLFASTIGIGGLTIADVGGIVTINSNTNATSVATGALRVVGGVGIQGNLWVGGTINGTIVGSVTGNATTATNIAGGTTGQVPYQTGIGATGFFGPGTAGDVLVSNGAAAPTYNNVLVLAGTTGASSTNTGALQVRGGVGIGGGLVVGNITTVTNTTNATNTATGALQVRGGAAVGLDLYVGGVIYQNGVPVGSGGTATGAAGVTTRTSATNATRYLTFVDNDYGSATTSSVYTDAGISYNPSTNDLTITGTFIQTPATLGSTLGNTSFYQSLRGNNGNSNLLETFMIRDSAGADWTTAGSRIQQKIDSTWMGYMQFNGANANYGIEWGSGASTVSPQAIAPRMRLTTAGTLDILTTTAASSTSTGALVVRGGIGANGNIYTSGNLFLENLNANLVLGNSALNPGLKTITLNRSNIGDTANINAGSQSYFGGSTNLDIINNSGNSNFDLRSFSSAGWGPTGQGVRIRIEGSQGDVQIFNDTQATSTSTGALQVRGGLAVGGNIHFGGQLFQNGVLFSAGGGETVVFNDISASFDGLESVFTLKDGTNNLGFTETFSAGVDWTAITLPLNGGGGAPPPSTTLLGTSVGAGSIVVPANVSTMVLEAWGGGGGSAGLNRTGTDTAGGGAFAQSVVTVTPGQTVFFSIGAGGTGGSTVGTAGAQSWINVGSNSVPVSSTTGVRAAGGAGSGVAFPNNSTQLANSVGTIINIGGAGPQQIDDGLGGGGGGASGLYAFTTFTFSTANTRGHQAPTLATLRSFGTYAAQSAWTANNSFLNYFDSGTFRGYQIWTVPATAAYTIEAAGAAAWSDGGTLRGGRGYARRATFNLTEGERIIIAVGQPGIGSRSSDNVDGGGGGGTFVVRYSGLPSGTPNTGNSTILLISGGGGHGSTVAGSTTQADGNAGQNASSSQTNQAGGSNGNGGPTGQGGQSCAGQGSGYFSDAGETPCGGLSTNGVARGFFTGLLGGAGTCRSDDRTSNGQGGFGGGGGNGCGGSGGGGGYSGGAGSWASGWASGGGSFINTTLGSAQVNLGATNDSYGYVTITKV